MQRLRQNWKIIAYLVGLFGLALSPHEGIGSLYGLAGIVWFVFWIVRNSAGGQRIDSEGKNGAFLVDDDPVSASYDDVTMNETHPLSAFYRPSGY